jgi:hypothetical protein
VIELRKGTVFIFTGEYPSDYFLNYIANTLPRDINKRVIKVSRSIQVNGYNIRLMKHPNERLRGNRPEFVYYIGFPSFDTVLKEFGDTDDYIKIKRCIESDTKILSERKKTIRYINEAEEIDIREFIDDDYSLL